MKNSLIRCIVIIIFSFAGVSLSAYHRPNLFPDTLQNGIGIEKTIAKLTAGQQVRIVYFGQSIISATGVVNWWPDTITQYLKEMYPIATMTATNAAISGYDAKAMVDQNIVAKKLVPLNPDLIFLCIYFHLESEMERMIRQIVSQLPSAEMVILNFHYSLPKDTHWNPTAQKSEVPWEDALSWDYLPWLCEKYRFGYLDIRTPWVKYIADFCNGVDILTNASDGIHLSPQGQWLMAEFCKPYFAVKKTDSIRPVVDSVSGLANKLFIRFNEKVDSVSANDASNYIIDGGVTIIKNVSLSPDGRTAKIVLISNTLYGTHTVALTAIKDRAGNGIAANTQESVTFPTSIAWNFCDIGRVYTPGSTTINQATGEFTLKGGGEHASPMNCAWAQASMTDRCDPYWMWRNEFHYAYMTKFGDFTFHAEVTSIDSLDSNSQVGLIIREDLQYLSRFVAIDVVKKDGGYFE